MSTFKERYDYGFSKFRNLDAGIGNIMLYPFVCMICLIYALVCSFEFVVLIIMIILYYIMKD